MSYSDFLKYFDNLEICNLSPDSLTDSQANWKIDVFEGEWIKGISSGGCNNRDTFHYNPQYILQLEQPDHDSDDEKCSLVLSLMQKNRRNKKKFGLELLTIGFKVFQLHEKDLEEKPLKSEFFLYNASVDRSTFVNLRSVSLKLRLSPGHYLIVPATYEPDDGEFLIRVFTHAKNSLDEHDELLGSGDVDKRVRS